MQRASAAPQATSRGDGDIGIGKLQLAVQETERYGEMFLDVRAEVVYTDKRRQDARQALTALRKQQQRPSSASGKPDAQPQVLLTRHGGVLMHLPLNKTIAALDKDLAMYDARMEELRREEKRLMGLLAGAGAGPSSVGPGMLQAMLNLRGGR